MNVYTYCADIYCQSCGEELVDLLDDYIPVDARDDSEQYPQGPTSDGGGEADAPQYCGKCGIFLENPLTNDGVVWVMDKLTEEAQEWGFYNLKPDGSGE